MSNEDVTMDGTEYKDNNQLVSLEDASTEGIQDGTLAKEYTLDIPRIPSLELPLNVSASHSSVQKSLEMCGGLSKIKKAFKEKDANLDSQKGLELSLNNNDPAFFNEHPITGKRVPFRDDSIVLKVSMPKGTLKKYNGDISKSLASLDSKDYKVAPVAIIDNTIKFRELSDFQVRVDNVPSAQEFQNSFNSLNWPNFKEFVNSVPDNDTRPYENINNIIMNRNLASPNGDYQFPPPPKFSMVGFPHLYKYKGNPFAKKKSNGITEVRGSYIKNYQLFVHDISDSVVIPLKPHEFLQRDYDLACQSRVYPGTRDDSNFFESLEECLKMLRELFSKRPIWVKRHLDGIIPKRIHHTIKIALALISYRFTMGPWRNTYIKFGIDPRSSNDYAKYQTEYFKIERKLLNSPVVKKNVPVIPSIVFESNVPGDIDSRFKFDGNMIPWYLMLQIDLLINEPNILQVYQRINYLDKPNELTGWIPELDLVKIRRIVKYELGCLAQGNHNFNQYKLKYFKSMKFSKESLMKEGTGEASNTEDADGDIDMNGQNSGDEARTQATLRDTEDDDDDEDNGIASGEIDETALEAEERDNDENVSTLPSSEEKEGEEVEGGEGRTGKGEEDEDEDEEEDDEDDIMDYKEADFQDIIARIAKLNPEEAEILQNRLTGFVHESKI